MEFDTKDFKSADFVKYAKMKLMMVIVLLFRKNIWHLFCKIWIY